MTIIYVKLKHKNARNDLQLQAYINLTAVSIIKQLKVLELASVLAGPGVGQFFAELGAEVIKVENVLTKGDVTRTWKSKDEQTDDRSAYFCAVNWGKKSIAVDLTKEEGKTIVYDLVRSTDIVIASYKPGDAQKLGVDYASLSRIKPDLIYGEITGYGAANHRVGYDAIIQAEAGFMFMNGEPGGPSLKMPVALMDILAGHQLKEALLLAIIEKITRGIGNHVQVSLIQSAIASLANQATNYLVGHSIPQKQGSAHPNIAPYGDVFRTKDNKEIIFAVGTDRQFSDLCDLLELHVLASDPKFVNNLNRVFNRKELQVLLAQKISTFHAHDLMDKVQKANIPSGVIRNLKEVFETPEAREVLLDSFGLKGVKTFISHLNTQNYSHFLPPPHYGEHTAIILKESLKYSAERVKSLISEAIIE
jgi:crotonobetainyl-CoA:carnitine CoA-transferase CaiB-like acyl-CoA transferase